MDSSIILFLMSQNVDAFMPTNKENFLGYHTLAAIFRIGVRGGNERKGPSSELALERKQFQV